MLHTMTIYRDCALPPSLSCMLRRAAIPVNICWPLISEYSHGRRRILQQAGIDKVIASHAQSGVGDDQHSHCAADYLKPVKCVRIPAASCRSAVDLQTDKIVVERNVRVLPELCSIQSQACG